MHLTPDGRSISCNSGLRSLKKNLNLKSVYIGHAEDDADQLDPHNTI